MDSSVMDSGLTDETAGLEIDSESNPFLDTLSSSPNVVVTHTYNLRRRLKYKLNVMRGLLNELDHILACADLRDRE